MLELKSASFHAQSHRWEVLELVYDDDLVHKRIQDCILVDRLLLLFFVEHLNISPNLLDLAHVVSFELIGSRIFRQRALLCFLLVSLHALEGTESLLGSNCLFAFDSSSDAVAA